MPSTFDLRTPGTRPSPKRDAGGRVLRNVLSFAPFLISPLQMSLLSRALDADGFGRWWWTIVLLELTSLLGMHSADLYVRRELPRHALAGDRAAMHDVVGSALAVAGGIGLALCVLQALAARWLAGTQHDPELALYIATLAVLPVLANLGSVLTAGLQSVDAYGSISLVRGVFAPLLQCAFLTCAWLCDFAVGAVLAGLVSVSALNLLASAAVYTRHFDLARTLAGARAASKARAVLSFGLPLVLPNALWTVGGKIDLYLLRPHVTPAALGVYAACLQLASVLPNTRGVFDPVVQAEIASLWADSLRIALGESLQRLSRLCALALLPLFVALVTLGEPALALLLGRPTPEAGWTLAVLSVGQFLGSIAVASWLVPMLLPGRALSLLAAATLACKVVLLLLLTPRFGAPGAAIATAVGTVLAQQGMAVLGSRTLRVSVYSRRLLFVSVVTLVGGMLSAAAQHSVTTPVSAAIAFVLGGFVAGTFSVLALLTVLDDRERMWIRQSLRSLRGAR